MAKQTVKGGGGNVATTSSGTCGTIAQLLAGLQPSPMMGEPSSKAVATFDASPFRLRVRSGAFEPLPPGILRRAAPHVPHSLSHPPNCKARTLLGE